MQNDLRFSGSRSIIRRKNVSSPIKTDSTSVEGSSFSIISRSFKDYKKFQEKKEISKNSFYQLNREYDAFLFKLQNLLSKTFKSVSLSRCDSSWQEPTTSIRFSLGRFEKINQDSFIRSSLVKVINICNDLVEEEEFEVKSIIERIDLRSSHKTDEVMISFVIKDSVNPGSNRLSKQDELNLKTLVFRLRDLGATITSSYYMKENHLTKIIGTDGLRESIADINIEVKPYTEFETNPYKTYDILRRFEQLIGCGDKRTMWNLNCGYGLESISAIRAGFTCFTQAKSSLLDSIYTNFDLNKKIIPESILVHKNEFITGTCNDTESKLEIPKKFNSPSIICINLDSTINPSILNTIVCGLSMSSYSRLFVYSKDLSIIEDISLKLKAYTIELKQLEAYQLLPTTTACYYLGIYTKNFSNN